VLSQQESETNTITVSGGAEVSEFKINALDYEENKHFFISQFFYNNYNKYLERLPIISSPINITKIEIWITNIGPATQENRNIVAFQDIGEYDPYNQNVLPKLLLQMLICLVIDLIIFFSSLTLQTSEI